VGWLGCGGAGSDAAPGAGRRGANQSAGRVPAHVAVARPRQLQVEEDARPPHLPASGPCVAVLGARAFREPRTLSLLLTTMMKLAMMFMMVKLVAIILVKLVVVVVMRMIMIMIMVMMVTMMIMMIMMIMTTTMTTTMMMMRVRSNVPVVCHSPTPHQRVRLWFVFFSFSSSVRRLRLLPSLGLFAW
jgi:hypothetical protein